MVAYILRYMANYSATLDHTFQALADPTRRRVLERLVQGPASVSELAEPFDMALPSFLQHLKVLEQSALVRSEKVGRVRTFHVVPSEMKRATHWLSLQLDLWERRLDQLDSYLQQLALQENDHE